MHTVVQCKCAVRRTNKCHYTECMRQLWFIALTSWILLWLRTIQYLWFSYRVHSLRGNRIKSSCVPAQNGGKDIRGCGWNGWKRSSRLETEMMYTYFTFDRTVCCIENEEISQWNVFVVTRLWWLRHCCDYLCYCHECYWRTDQTKLITINKWNDTIHDTTIPPKYIRMGRMGDKWN